MSKTTAPAAQRSALLAFMRDFPFCQVRDRVLALKNGIPARRFSGDMQFPQLRTKANTHLASIADELGNRFVLTRTGQRLQLLAGE